MGKGLTGAGAGTHPHKGRTQIARPPGSHSQVVHAGAVVAALAGEACAVAVPAVRVACTSSPPPPNGSTANSASGTGAQTGVVRERAQEAEGMVCVRVCEESNIGLVLEERGISTGA